MTKDRPKAPNCELRAMTREDRDTVLAFARALEPHDLLFLRRDITEREVVEGWVEAIENGRIVTTLALDGEQLLGYATIDRSGEPWTRHVAEVRVVVGPGARGRGLGRFLAEQAFRQALQQGVEKLVARMTLDQVGAIAVFEGLGFRPEGLLKDHVVDREGAKHDLLVMAHSVAEFEEARAGFGVAEALA